MIACNNHANLLLDGGLGVDFAPYFSPAYGPAALFPVKPTPARRGRPAAADSGGCCSPSSPGRRHSGLLRREDEGLQQPRESTAARRLGARLRPLLLRGLRAVSPVPGEADAGRL